MNRLYVTLLLWSLSIPSVLAQNALFDSLHHLLAHTRHDTSRVLLLAELSHAYNFYSSDSSLKLAQQALTLARRLNFIKGEGQAIGAVGIALRERGDLPQGLDYGFKALKIARATNNRQDAARIMRHLSNIYIDLGESRQALNYLWQSKKMYESISDQPGIALTWAYMSYPYLFLNLQDSAQFVVQQAHRLAMRLPRSPSLTMSRILRHYGRIEALAGNSRKALYFYREAVRVTYLDTDLRSRAIMQTEIAGLFEKIHQPDSSLRYGHLALVNSQQAHMLRIPEISSLLTRVYKSKNNLDSAFKYQEIATAANDSMYGAKKFQQLQRLSLAEQQRQQALVVEQKEYKDRIQFYALLAGLGTVLLLAFVLWRNNRQKQEANIVLQKTLTELKATQTQLIQKERLASLGELTAGIAHEIQNPLNFVNNFSEVSSELLGELKEGPFQKLPASEKEYADEILGDLSQNLEKITHHGSRASSIVRGMLEHSRTSTGTRQPTDLNALVDDYLRLAYQGLRAKDQAFNTQLSTDLDPDLPKVDAVPQEMGRVLLNLFNNALYAVSQKQKQVVEIFTPEVKVSTRNLKDTVEIRVRDNGIGIPKAVLDKIFQPFFTTKPTGQGTGLGLSLAYDIITKGHSGTLNVETEEGEFAEFIITLPVVRPNL